MSGTRSGFGSIEGISTDRHASFFKPNTSRTFSEKGEFAKLWKTNTRLTFGGYYASKNVFAPFQRAGGQFAAEQKVSKRVTLAADWFTGNSSVGYVTPGAIVKLTSKITWYITYQVGNAQAASGNHQVLTEFGWNLN